MPSIVKERLLRKKKRTHSLRSFKKTKFTQTSGSETAERIEQVKKKQKIELEIFEIVHSFPDGYVKGNVVMQTNWLLEPSSVRE